MYKLLAIISFLLVFNPSYSAEVMTKERQQAKTPQLVLQRLIEGNQRFVTGTMKNRDLILQANVTAAAQHPIAVVLSCMDARTPPEVIFDQGIGDIFALRVAGNLQNQDMLGSMEFGTKVVGAKLIAVIGHTSCGAMNGACEQVKMGNLTAVLDKIQPAVTQASKTMKKDCKNAAFIDEVTKDNVLLVIQQIKEQSAIINQLLKDGEIGIVGGVQDLQTGTVTFFHSEINNKSAHAIARK